MDSLKRRFLSQFGKVSAGAALIPITGINTAVASTAIRNNNQPDRKGEVGKRYAMAVDLRKCVGCQACSYLAANSRTTRPANTNVVLPQVNPPTQRERHGIQSLRRC